MLEPQILPMEESRMKTIMRKSRWMQRLGTRFVASVVVSPTIFSPKKSNNDPSGPRYDPEGGISEGDLSGDETLVTEETGLQVVPLPASSPSCHDFSLRCCQIILCGIVCLLFFPYVLFLFTFPS